MVCVVDTSNIFFITWSMFLKDKLQQNGDGYIIQDEDTGLFFHMFLRKIMPYITSYRDCVFCFEGLHSTAWRKSIYPLYKENRKKDDPNYKWIGPLMEKCFDYLSNFHVKCLKIDNCEGDDCIYAAAKFYAEKGEQVRIVSNDKDLSQIINFYPELVSQYNPIKQCDIEANENILLEKAIVGDSSDNIKVFHGIGPKTFEKMLNDQALWNKKMTPENQALLDMIMQIIDLRKYPQQYQDAIKTELDKEWNSFDKDGVEKFLLDNGLKKCYEDWSDWCAQIELLESGNEQDSFAEIMDMIGGK